MDVGVSGAGDGPTSSNPVSNPTRAGAVITCRRRLFPRANGSGPMSRPPSCINRTDRGAMDVVTRLSIGREVWVAGFPSFYGVTDTELDHLIDPFRACDVAEIIFGPSSVREQGLDRREGARCGGRVTGVPDSPALFSSIAVIHFEPASTLHPARALWERLPGVVW